MKRKYNISEILNVLLVIALIIVVSHQSKFHPNSVRENPVEVVKTAEIQKDAITIIHERKSVRNFVPRKMVSKEDMMTLVKAGMSAPSARNAQPWEFVIITDPSIMDELSLDLPYAKMLVDAGGAIVVCGNLKNALEGDAQTYWVQDCSAATQNVLLAAEALGLGAVWTGVFPIDERVKTVASVMGLPSDIIPLCVIPIGYPTGKDQPKNKFTEEKLHWNKWL